MVLDLILYLFFLFLLEVIDLFPDAVALPSAIDSSLTLIVPILSQLNSILPIATIFVIFGLYLTIEGGLLLFKIINWIINKLRGSG